MKNKSCFFANLISIILLFLLLIVAIFHSFIKTGTLLNNPIDTWTAAILSLAIYFLFDFFIKNPQFLVKKTRIEFENPERQSEATIDKWQQIFCYLRPALIGFIVVLYFTK